MTAGTALKTDYSRVHKNAHLPSKRKGAFKGKRGERGRGLHLESGKRKGTVWSIIPACKERMATANT